MRLSSMENLLHLLWKLKVIKDWETMEENGELVSYRFEEYNSFNEKHL